MPKQKLKVEITNPSEELIKRFDRLFFLIIGAILIGFISMLFMVTGIVIDAWRFNTSVYKEMQQGNVVNSLNEIKKDIQELKTQ